MGVGRMIHVRELRKDFQAIKDLSSDEKGDLKDTVKDFIYHINYELGIPLEEILNSKNYHPVSNKGWGQIPSIINTRLRIPFLKVLSPGGHPNDYANRIKYYSISMILYSTRAVLDFEFNQNKKQMHMCQNLWHEIFPDDPGSIPLRFRPDV